MTPTIFDEQFEFLQEAQVPIVMLSVLLAIPRTPLYNRLKAEGRLLIPDPTGTRSLALRRHGRRHQFPSAANDKRGAERRAEAPLPATVLPRGL